ncbi:hypothetical protein D3C86_1717240 [compost metagenome]
MNELQKNIASLFEVNTEDLKTISSFFHPVTVNKGDYFLKSGTYANRMGFIQSGIMRELVHLPDKEITK